MARFADRVTYRFAGLVWTALYGGLCRRSTARQTTTLVENDVPALVEPALQALAA